MKLKNCKVGVEVKIKKSSKWYGRGFSNPKDTVGVITEVLEYDDPVYVEWPDGVVNCYKPEDLKMVKKEPKLEEER